jgi:hypothetical protein
MKEFYHKTAEHSKINKSVSTEKGLGRRHRNARHNMMF